MELSLGRTLHTKHCVSYYQISNASRVYSYSSATRPDTCTAVNAYLKVDGDSCANGQTDRASAELQCGRIKKILDHL